MARSIVDDPRALTKVGPDGAEMVAPLASAQESRAVPYELRLVSHLVWRAFRLPSTIADPRSHGPIHRSTASNMERVRSGAMYTPTIVVPPGNEATIICAFGDLKCARYRSRIHGPAISFTAPWCRLLLRTTGPHNDNPLVES